MEQVIIMHLLLSLKIRKYRSGKVFKSIRLIKERLLRQLLLSHGYLYQLLYYEVIYDAIQLSQQLDQ